MADAEATSHTPSRHIAAPVDPTIVNWDEVIGRSPDIFCDEYVRHRPVWLKKGSISNSDARFLFRAALTAGASCAVEIGTASGFSTGLLCQALSFAAQAKAIPEDFHVVSYDIASRFYDDQTRMVGDAAIEQLERQLQAHITFRAPATALDLWRYHGLDSIPFMFLDANHRHPWPTLDLLAALDYLAPGALVVMHDINLPLRHPDFNVWGVKYLFDGLRLEKSVPTDEAVPNIGSIHIPSEKLDLHDNLLRILYAHPWEADVDASDTTRVFQTPTARDNGHPREPDTSVEPAVPGIEARTRGSR